MNVLIIGSKGFIGSHCVDYFSEKYKVWECDVVTDYVNENYYIVDATNADYNEIFKQQQFDVCINCSGASSVPDSIKKPQRDFTLNTLNVFKQLDAIRQYNSNCKYITLSSAAVYGNPLELPIVESDSLRPISPYGVHKKMAEEICQSFYKNYKIKSCALRIFSAYGEGLKKQLFWDLAHKKKLANKVKLYGTGMESRDFIYIDDIVNAIDIVIKNGLFNGEVLNVASGTEVSIKEASELFFNIFNESIKANFGGEERKGDPMNWVADISQLKFYGYKQKTNLIEGISRYIKWLIENELV